MLGCIIHLVVALFAVINQKCLIYFLYLNLKNGGLNYASNFTSKNINLNVIVIIHTK